MLRNILINTFRYFVIRFFDFFRPRTKSSSFLNCFVNDHLHIDSKQPLTFQSAAGSAFGCYPIKPLAMPGDIQNLEALVMVVKVKLLDGRVLRGKAAAGSCIHYQNHYFSGYTSMAYHVYLRVNYYMTQQTM